MLSQPIHQLRPADAYAALESSPEGLSAAEAAARQELFGENRLKEATPAPAWKRLGRHFLHPFSLALIAAGGAALIAGEPALGAAIWLVVLFNTGFSFWRVHHAEEAMQALRRLLPGMARVVRGGEEDAIPVDEVVPGDLLVLAEGDYIAADARVVEEFGLRVSNAVLTGEAIPARKTADASFRDGIGELERPNLVFAGTTVVSGTGRAVVTATGMRTQFGRVAALTQAAPEEASVFQAELAQLTRRVGLAALAISALVFVIALADVGLSWRAAFLLMLGVLVAAIPEGLQANVTLSLAAAAQRLAGQGVLVKRLAAIETLGSLSVICTDKSGTLTQNQMTVRAIWVGGRRLAVGGVGYEPRGEIAPVLEGPSGEDLRLLLTAGSLCNNARLTRGGNGKPVWGCLGDQTEAAMLAAALKGGVDNAWAAAVYPRLHELPFDARRKRMSTIHKLAANGNGNGNGRHLPAPAAAAEAVAVADLPLVSLSAAVVVDAPARNGKRHANGRRGEIAFVKGSPREILELCTDIRINGEEVAFDASLRRQVEAAIDDYAAQALRVLALACRALPARHGAYTAEQVERGLTFLGLMAMHDPPRPEVQQLVSACRGAGIRIIMITGDYGLTAAALGRRVGLIDGSAARIITGGELEALSDGELAALLDGEVVFARMAPEHKLRVVAALQARGEVVAVTGDGVNDAPALRKADIGVAMGIGGAEVAQKAADIVLIDDNFLNLAAAIQEGRAVYENLRKFVTYIFASNVPEILPFVLTAASGLPLALTVRQILAIDFGTDMLPGLALGVEPPEPGIMQRPPRKRSSRLIDGSVLGRAFLWLGPIETLLAYSGFFLVYALLAGDAPFAWTGWSGLRAFFQPAGAALPVYALAVTMYHAGVVMAQIGNVFACRSPAARGRTLGWFKNRAIWLAVAVELAAILALIYIPALAQMFNHAPLPPRWWLWLALYPPALYLFDRIWKLAARRFPAGRFNAGRSRMEAKQ